MISIMISGRRLEGQTLDSFYHEFESTHVGLMRKAHCERFITRYTQNKAMQVAAPLDLWVNIDSHYDSQASLVFTDLEVMGNFFSDPDYNEIVKKHEFIDPSYMTFELAEERIIKPGQVGTNSVKVLYYFKPHSAISRHTFQQIIDGPFSDLTINARPELLSLGIRSYCFPPDQTHFITPIFPKGKISQYAVIDELWFSNMGDLQSYHQGIKHKLHQQLSDKIDFDQSFALLVTDKVIIGTRPIT